MLIIFEISNKVYIRLGKGYYFLGSPKSKFLLIYIGLYKIIKKVGPLAYRFNLSVY